MKKVRIMYVGQQSTSATLATAENLKAFRTRIKSDETDFHGFKSAERFMHLVYLSFNRYIRVIRVKRL
jgi:hypothetical protein